MTRDRTSGGFPVRVAAIAAALAFSVGLVTAAKIPTIRQKALLQQMDSEDPPLVLDVRTPEEFEKGHLPGALNIPYDRLAERLDQLTEHKQQTIVLYCDSGSRAYRAGETLREAGFEKLLHLEGDWVFWRGRGRPIERTDSAASD